MAQMVKNLPAMQETQVRSLGQEEPLEKGMATHCSILPWRIPLSEKPGRLQSMGSQRVGHNRATKPPPSPPWRTCTKASQVIFVFSFLIPLFLSLS